ncbi:nucleotidyltransferase family protein [Erythrobacter litoralis]|uniref:nucleotidyltransferase family protein n=1 Tax=Erythrobacter litoralis TaxID=39960 RepID=UPI0024353FEE|nr:nucleotidyltransferase family protein [Erythrobacter litoralis]
MEPLDDAIAYVLLAAGRSTRFGGDKLLAEIDGRRLIDIALHTAEAAGFARRVLVIGPDLAGFKSEGWTIVVNEQPQRGMASSIRIGLPHASSAKRVVIGLADMPFIGADHLRRLASSEGVVFTTQKDGTRGAPAAFPETSYDRLMMLEGDRGAASINWDRADTIEPFESGALVDIDTKQDLEAAETGVFGV